MPTLIPAPNSFALELGGLRVAFESASTLWSDTLLPRYGAFRSDLQPRFRIRLEVSGGERVAAVLAPRLLAESVEIALAGDELAIRSPSVRGAVDLARGEGWLQAPLHRHGVDLLLRALLAATQTDALLMHAALIEDGGRSFAVAGPSGAGKSTLARLLADRACCDELLLVRRSGDGWQASALPFWHGRPGGGRLAGVHLLQHGDAHRLRRLERGEKTRRLAPEIVWPSFSPAHSEQALALFDRLLAEVPVSELSFLPRADVWPVLAGEAA